MAGFFLQASGQISVRDIHDVWVNCNFPAFYDLNAYKGQTVYNSAAVSSIVPSTNLDIEFFYDKTPINFGGGGGGK